MKNYLSLVKFSHTVFAMPFALIGFSLAATSANYTFGWQKLALVLACMVLARNAAMAFNRYIDRRFDAANPRTRVREIPSGVISPQAALGFVIFNSVLFCICCYFINTLCFWLSPVALGVILGYSITKRFTALCHLVLGVGLALAPIGAYLAVSERFALLPLLYSFAVFFWVSGFDIIYALQDEAFDRSQQLHSIPVLLGGRGALMLSNGLHLLCALLIVGAAVYGKVGVVHWAGVVIFLGLLFYQHTLVKVTDLSKVNLAFFTTNGIASVLFGVLVLFDLWVV